MIMKKIYRNILLATFAITLMGCTERHDEVNLQPKVPHTFSAVIEYGDVTKTTLGDYPEEGNTTSRSVMWEYMDSIVVSCSHWYSTDLFVNKNESTSGIAVFEGNTSPDDRHFALYPYNTDIEYYTYDNQHEYHFNLPLVQKYSTNSIGRKSFPMVGRKIYGEDRFYFKNLCGALVVQLTGTETVKSITFSGIDAVGNPMVVSGHARVNLDYTEIPTMEMYPDNGKYPTYDMVTLDCGDGVALDPATPTPFYIVLPPATYSSFQLMISTTSGKVMLKESDKPLTISRSRSAKAAALTYTETIPVNLSERGTSNSYIVSDGGIYSFDASVIGNGSAGIIPNAAFHTSDPSISPASVELLWEDKSGIISGLAYNSDEKRISFMSHGVEGNALIAAKDANGTILWSWHIWCTDTPAEHIYINHQNQHFTVMDRNLGATRADRGSGDQWKEAVGLLYQWGRKDPFTYHPKIMKIGYQLSIQESIENADRLCSQYEWMANGNTRLWSDTTKTIYDPCPTGYKVAPRAIWTGFIQEGLSNTQRENQINKKGNFNKGWDFLYDGVNSAYYPTTYRGGYWEINYSPSDTEGRYWSSTSEGINRGHDLYFRFQDSYDLNMNLNGEGSGYAGSIRCVADNNYVDPTLPTVSKVVISSITAKGASAKVSVTSSGSSAVTAKGVVWSTEPKPTIELSTKTENGTGSGDYTAVLTGLNDLTKYYVRSYATNSYGTAYGPEVEFSTKFGGEATDLSATESANSYIVNEPATFYKFKAVKGNSSQTLENAFYASVVWESFGTNIKPLTGDLIENVVYQDGYIVFKTSSTSKEGNALIAAKDSEGTILWSWHIWLTDTPAEHTYANGAAILMDRNLGATSATPGDVQALGLLYQWGRKDPFLGNASVGDIVEASSTIVWPKTEYYTTYGNIEYVTSHPTTLIRSDEYGSNRDWLNGHDSSLWGKTKTIYDPCPAGWRVAEGEYGLNGVWDITNLNPIFDNTNRGYMIELSNEVLAWYPLTGYRTSEGYWSNTNWACYIWCYNVSTSNYKSYSLLLALDPSFLYHEEYKSHALSVRCQKITE